MNNLTVIGNLVNNPETKTVNTKNGPQSVTNFRFACNGRDRSKTTYIRATAWGNVGKTIEQYAKAGSKMMLGGEATASAFLSAKTGEIQATLELTIEKFEFLASANPAPKAESTPSPTVVTPPTTETYDTPEDDDDSFEDEDLPF